VVTVPDLSPNTPAMMVPRGDLAPRGCRPGPTLVIGSSAAFFGVIFALLAYPLSVRRDPSPSTATSSRPIVVRQIVKHRVVTTTLPTPGRSTVTSSRQLTAAPTYAPITTGAS
jgi:hypothetical protein